MPALETTTSTTTTTTSLLTFVNTVPAPLTTVLVGLASLISTVRYVLEVVSWTASSPFDSWLALAAWWTVCLLAEPGLRYFLPVAIFCALANRWISRPRLVPPPATEHTIDVVVSDLITIRALLVPSIPTIPSVPSTDLLRVLALLYPPYLILTYLVRLRILAGIAGTLLLSWRAPWASVIRHNLWRSAWVRWSIYYTWSFLSGQPLPPKTHTLQPASTTTTTNKHPVHETRFLFTIYENQRWWVTLDWTPALLPSERPAWCSHTHAAVSPPSTFSLPEPSTVFLTDDKGRRAKRTSTWRWEESEWKILVKTQGDQVKRVEKEKNMNPDSPSRSKHTKTGSNTASEVREASAMGSSKAIEGEDDNAKESSVDKSSDPTPEESNTDADGWVYCDNKWEHPTNVNGRSKFTRYRRWARVAVVSEVVEPVGPEEVETKPNDTSAAAVAKGESQSPTVAKKLADSTADTTSPPEASPVVSEGDTLLTADSPKKRTSIRQRMQDTLQKVSGA